MKINNIDYFKLSYLKFHLDDELDKLQHLNGIYYWVYWPEFDDDKISTINLIQLLTAFTEKKLSYSEFVKGKYKFSADIYEQWFRDNGNIFGLSPSKDESLKNHLRDRNNIKSFSIIFKELCFARPFYIGKANNLKQRLSNHFNYKTQVLKQIDSANIEHSHIWIGYKLIYDPNDEGLNVIFEEIFSRTFKPGLTIKPN